MLLIGRREGRREGLPAAAALGLETHPEVNKAFLDLLRDAGEAGTADLDESLLEVVEGEEVGDGVLVLGREGGKEGGRER